MNKEDIRCSFCGRNNVQVVQSIDNTGKEVYICKDCAGLALDFFKRT